MEPESKASHHSLNALLMSYGVDVEALPQSVKDSVLKVASDCAQRMKEGEELRPEEVGPSVMKNVHPEDQDESINALPIGACPFLKHRASLTDACPFLKRQSEHMVTFDARHARVLLDMSAEQGKALLGFLLSLFELYSKATAAKGSAEKEESQE